jgi:uncharacterized membrane protein
MTKYLSEVSRYLKGIPKMEQTEILDYYNEYILDSGMSDAEVAEHFGPAKQFARKLRLDYLMNQDEEEVKEKPTRHLVTMIWLVILGIFAAPILLPLAFAAAAVAFAFVIAIGAVIFAIYVTVISIFFAGLTAVVSGIVVMPQSVASALWFVGGGLAMTGLGILLLPILFKFTKWIWYQVVRFIKFLANRFVVKGSVRYAN